MESDFMSETGTYVMPLLPDGMWNHWRVDMLPSSDDERDFIERAARMHEEGKTDAAGREHPGALYCNVKLTIYSTCEWETQPWKGGVRSDDMDICADYDPLDNSKPNFPPTVSCYDEVLPEIFDGADETAQYASEALLSSAIIINCLSMNATTDLCDPASYSDGLGAPCEGMDWPV
eukprot:scaffold563_cov208-Pinguiococcus_pyrenoidosus.AAC.2